MKNSNKDVIKIKVAREKSSSHTQRGLGE